MITGFDPENYADWELFRKAARNQHHFFWNIENAEFWNEEKYDSRIHHGNNDTVLYCIQNS